MSPYLIETENMTTFLPRQPPIDNSSDHSSTLFDKGSYRMKRTVKFKTLGLRKQLPLLLLNEISG